MFNHIDSLKLNCRKGQSTQVFTVSGKNNNRNKTLQLFHCESYEAIYEI